MQRTRTKPQIHAGQPLVLTAPDGRELLTFSPEIAEQLRYMVARSGKTELPKKLAMLSALSGDGVTFTTFALAAVLAHDLGKKVCVVDLNWYNPSKVFPLGEDEPGLAGVLLEQSTLENALQPTGWDNLTYLPAGTVPVAQRPALARSPRLAEQIERLGEQYDHLLFDLPAALSTSDALALASLADAACLVVRQGATPDHDVRKTLEQAAHLNVLGIILNRVQFSTPLWLRRAIAGN